MNHDARPDRFELVLTQNSSNHGNPLMGQWVRSNLEFEDRGDAFRSAFRVERGSAPRRRPDRSTFPASAGVVYPPVQPLAEEASERIRHTKIIELTFYEREHSLGQVSGCQRHVLPDTQEIEPVGEVVVSRFGAAGVRCALVVRTRERIERPAFSTMPAGGSRPVERTFTLAAVEARKVTTRQHRPTRRRYCRRPCRVARTLGQRPQGHPTEPRRTPRAPY